MLFMNDAKAALGQALETELVRIFNCYLTTGEGMWLRHVTVSSACVQEERLPLWLRPYEVLVTSDRTALIEFVPNTASIHAIKSKSPPGTSLRDHYLARFGPIVCCPYMCPSTCVPPRA